MMRISRTRSLSLFPRFFCFFLPGFVSVYHLYLPSSQLPSFVLSYLPISIYPINDMVSLSLFACVRISENGSRVKNHRGDSA